MKLTGDSHKPERAGSSTPLHKGKRKPKELFLVQPIDVAASIRVTMSAYKILPVSEPQSLVGFQNNHKGHSSAYVHMSFLTQQTLTTQLCEHFDFDELEPPFFSSKN